MSCRSLIRTEMGFTPEYRARIEKVLSDIVPIRTKAMFGGVGIYSEDLFFGLIAEDKLYFKVDETNRPDFEKMGMEPFYPFDSPKPMGYWEVPPNLLGNSSELKDWIERALQVAASKKKR